MLTLDIRHSMCFFMLEPPKSDTIFVRHFFFKDGSNGQQHQHQERMRKTFPSKVHSRLKSEKRCISDQPNSGYVYKAVKHSLGIKIE